MVKDNIQTVVDNYNCTSCGICVPICPVDCISMPFDETKGLYIPHVNQDTCINCQKCVNICSGEDINFKELTEQLLDSENYDSTLKSYNSINIGYSNNKDIRFNGASGGVITSILEYLFDTRQIDGALVLVEDKKNPFLPSAKVIRDKNELGTTQGSWYCPSPTNIAIKDILENEGRYAIIGLPCHLHSIRKLQQKNRKFNQRVFITLGLFCANNNSSYGTDFFFKCNGIEKKKVQNIKYRADGWPGKIQVDTIDEKILIKRGTSENSLYKSALLSDSFHYMFSQPRCLICRDQTNELADISFGDPHMKEIRDYETKGISWFISRSSVGERVLNEAVSEGYITKDIFEKEKALKAQNYKFKESYANRLYFWKLLGRKTPNYGEKHKRTKLNLSGYKYFWSFFYSGQLLVQLSSLIRAFKYIKFSILTLLVKIKRMIK